MNLKQAFIAVLVLAAAGIISACLDEAESHSGVSGAEFQLLLERVATLEANQPGDKVFAGDGTGGLAKAVTAAGKPLGTAIGFLPVDAPTHRSRAFSIKSSTGYLYAVPNHNQNTNGVVGIEGLASTGTAAGLYFLTADCTGQAYVGQNDISAYGASQGVVFMIGAGEFNQIIDDPAQYFYVPAGSSRFPDAFGTQPLNYQSLTNRVGFCTTESGTFPLGSFAAFQNVPAVTGVDSAPIPIPVGLAEEMTASP